VSFRNILDLVILSAVWGASFLFMRVATPEFGAIALMELRVSIALAFLLPFFVARSGLAELRVHWKPICFVGVFTTAIPFCLLAWATLSLTAGSVSIVNATTPIFGALVAWLWLDEKLATRQVVGLLLGFAGVVVLLGDRVGETGSAALTGAFTALGASTLYGLGANFARRYLDGVSAVTVSTGSMISATVLLLPGALLTWPQGPVSPEAWLSVLIMGVASTGIAYLLFFRLLKSVGPARALTVTYLVPLFAILWGGMFLAEPVTAGMLAGGTITLLGTSLATGLPLRRSLRAAAD